MASTPQLTPQLAAPPIAGEAQTARAVARQRLSVLLLLFLFVPPVLGLRMMEYAVLGAEGPAQPKTLSSAPPRADIVDRHGAELARTFEAYAITVEPRKLASEPRDLARRIAAILGTADVEAVRADLVHRDSFRYLARRVLPSQAKRINDLGEPAVHLKREDERLYPNLNLAAHVIGYTDEQGRGVYGIEKTKDARLSDPARRHQPLALSVDVRVQQALDAELRAMVADQAAEGAGGVVLDVHSGEILALASVPDFNPNAPGQDGAPPFNIMTYGLYELGSTFKALTIASAIDAGTIKSMDQGYDATRPLRIAGFTITDDHAKNRVLTVPEIFIHSSNIGTARIAIETGRERQRAMLEQLGFMQPVVLELTGLRPPRTPPLANWGESATVTISYGHGIQVTPMHLASAYAALVNGGTLPQLTLLKRGGPAPEGRRVFSPRASEAMRKLLRLVVLKGTGKRANAPGYRIGGKTGTANKIENRRYVHGANISSFAAAFPMDAPRYVVVVMVDNPRGSKATAGLRTAGMVVAPVVGRLVPRIAPLLGVNPDPGRDIDVSSLLPGPAEVVE